MFYLLDNNFANYADDTTPFAIGESFEEIKEKLELVACKLFSWLSNNQMKGNPEKCHLITNIKNTDLAISIANSKLKIAVKKNF